MGGHGGLNILPQKSWHVYRADNRSKVEKDEAEARAEDEAARSKHADAEREFRRQVLLHRKGIADTSTTADSTEPNEAAPTAPISHINFWSEDETRLAAEHPEVAAEKKEAAKRRGKADFYTTDAKFDEKFQLGYQMSDKKPWYAHKPSNIESELDNAAKHGTSTSPAHKAGIVKIKPHEAGKRQLAQAPGQPQPDVGSLSKKGHLSEVMSVGGGGDAAHNSSSSNSSNSSDSDSDSDSSPSSRHDRKLKQQRRSRSHSKNSKNKRARGKDKRSNSSKHKRRRAKESRPSTAKSIEQLREERIEREQLERTRERHVLLGAMPVSEPKGYNSGFGYAASLKRTRR